MPIIGVKLGLTLQVGERDFFRPEVSIDGIDTDKPLEPQLEAVNLALPITFDKVSDILYAKVKEYTGKKGG